jgi:N-acetylglutamate synthase-like GNAT family acetyltransferase
VTGRVSIRRPGSADIGALHAMFDRCSADTRRRRFHGNRGGLPARYLTDAVTGLHGNFSLVAEVADELIVALASCVTVAPDLADIAVLVEDDYQRQGIGSTLLRLLVAHADYSGVGTVQAAVLAEQEWILRLIRHYGDCSTTVSMGAYEVTLHREKGRPAWIG